MDTPRQPYQQHIVADPGPGLLGRWGVALIVALFVLLVAPVAQAQPSEAPAPGDKAPSTSAPDGNTGLGIRLLEVPEHLKDDPRALNYIIDNVPPGTTFTRRVEVFNRTGAPGTFQVYTGAARISSDGAFGPAEDGTVTELTTWMSVDTSEVTLADREAAEVVATIAVPADAPEGEQYGVLWAQSAGPAAEGMGAQVINRVGIRVYLSVGPGNGPPADFVIDSLTPRRSAEGLPEILVDLSNTGGRAVDILGDLNLSDGPGQLSAGPFTARSLTLPPGERSQMVFTLSDSLPNGPWTAALTLKSGLLTRTASVTLTFPDSGTGTSVPPDSPQTVPWLWLAVIAGAAGSLVVVLTLRRKKARTS